MADNFKRIAIVTGATSGIGEATAETFIRNGYGVVGNGRNREKLNSLEKEHGAAFCGVQGDASHTEIIDALFDKAEEHFGRQADVIVANAGRGLGGSVKDADLSQFQDVLNINVTGTLFLIQKAAKKLVELQESRFPDSAADIIIIGSTVGRMVSPFSSVYGATKFAVHSLAEGLRREVGPLGVRVSLVEPAIVISKFQEGAGYSDELTQSFHDKFGPLMQTEDIANAIQYIVQQPPHVHVNDIMIRSTRQDYP
ncbi:SDR family oxidoreductase [Natronogracilivirga saccharolytica]|uniref:SDR family oxidoreductase n=1 Tax=Natronogracilivirga saccharolytica TaxID=2812953 RepID=A0A8J7RQ59_9BACT|nr:SDR family oxidoreductase [Natronogracilivirga saccharolytica]MBP3191864.1 SDR family oxidoreductase [Natronogracilivirga saccharolytica]